MTPSFVSASMPRSALSWAPLTAPMPAVSVGSMPFLLYLACFGMGSRQFPNVLTTVTTFSNTVHEINIWKYDASHGSLRTSKIIFWPPESAKRTWWWCYIIYLFYYLLWLTLIHICLFLLLCCLEAGCNLKVHWHESYRLYTIHCVGAMPSAISITYMQQYYYHRTLQNEHVRFENHK